MMSAYCHVIGRCSCGEYSIAAQLISIARKIVIAKQAA
jgi:hypothetical protein